MNGVIDEKAKYAWTLEKEFEKTFTLLPDETLEYKKRGVVFTGKLILQCPALIALTNQRVVFLKHWQFAPDRLLAIPLNEISRIGFKNMGFLRGGQTAISLAYDGKAILFAITRIQSVMTGFSSPAVTEELFELLKQKLSSALVEERITSLYHWEYYLFLIGLLVGYHIGGALPVVLCAGFGFVVGKVINRALEHR